MFSKSSITLVFKKLEKNNNREWFAENKSEYDAALKATKAVFNEMYLKMQVHDDQPAGNYQNTITYIAVPVF